jgi:hypothetical protein
MPAQKVAVIDYRKANAADSLLPKPSILSSSGWGCVAKTFSNTIYRFVLHVFQDYR